jgi:ribosomal protein S18 acetylase RimI-like enzyme
VDHTLYIVVLNVFPEFQGQGIARRLIRGAIEQGQKQGCEVACVATTNDDIPALCFYQKMGFRLVDLLSNAVAGHHGEELIGFAGIPVLDEIRLERRLK